MKIRSHTRGSTLIEVLVAILLACVGLLAMARLSAAALSHQKAAQMRLVGQTLVQQYAERARLNVYGFDLAAYDIHLDSVKPGSVTLNADATDDKDAATQLGQADRLEFMQAVASTLPEGRVEAISRPSGTARDLDIWLLWRDTALDDADSLNGAVPPQCPRGLSNTARKGANCMHFRVGL